MFKRVFIISLIIFSSLCLAKDKTNTLNILAWTNYFPKDVITTFEKKYHARVYITNYHTDDMRDALIFNKNNIESYDLVIAPEKATNNYLDAGFTLPLDKKMLPNLAYVDDQMIGTHRIKGYSVLLSYMLLGAIKNNKLSDNPSWKTIVDDGTPYHNRILYTDDYDDLFTIGAFAQQKNIEQLSLNDTVNIAQYLTKNKIQTPTEKEQNKALNLINTGTKLLSVEYDTNYDQYNQEKTTFYFPNNTTRPWRDYIFIHSHSKSIQLSHQFINFILSEKIARKIKKHNGYHSSNKNITDKLPPALVIQKEAVYSPINESKRVYLFSRLFKNMNPIYEN